METDEEPPHPLNPEALEVSLIIASLMNMKVVDEFHTMRKQVIDGSNTGGFQRTGLVATDGYMDTDYGRVTIENLCLEEDAARRMGQKGNKTAFRLDRLGIPLVEITTDPSIKHPEQVKDVAYQIGQVLRSTKVKRGLGTIRQDLNISIREGARVEIKGVQDLDLMPKMVENEVKRQINLISIKDDLLQREAQVSDEIFDVGELFQKTESKIISKALKNGKKILAIKLEGFSGILGREIQPGRRFGTELAGYAKKMGVGGIFHTDELPAYGITTEEVSNVLKAMKASENDLFVLVADDEEKAKNALLEVQRRAKTALLGVPEETRKVLEDANSEYLRPLPTASRMYVETDIPAIVISNNYIKHVKSNLPELPQEKKERIREEYDLSEDLASQLIRMDKAEDFEKLTPQYNKVEPTLIASTLAYTIKELRREGLDVNLLTLEILEDTLDLIERDTIPAAAVPDVLRSVAKNGYTPQEAAQKEGLKKLNENEVQDTIHELVLENHELIKQRGMGAMGPLMGKAMAKFQGKADGKQVNKLLREEIDKINK